ncbi:MAG: TetR/AcrR family transcriptional regulator [Pseudomonadales bacterium]|nr:TetR/AcrR family transcriptional regulator [Pseudomonadales bacterium]
MQKASQKAQEFRRREEEILQKAQDLFIEHGEDKVTVEMIADAVGIGKGTIYKHFETKDEIFLRLMIRYEEQLGDVFDQLDDNDDKDRTRLAKEYFGFRMKNPEKYALFDRLEHKLTSNNACPELVEKLHATRAHNLETLVKTLEARIAEGKLEDVPAHYHIFAAWALVHGAVALYHSKFYSEFIDDKDKFFNFLIEIGIRMGNKRATKED